MKGLFSLSLSLACVSALAQTYHLTVVGPLTGSDYNQATAVNDSGQLVCNVTSEGYRAYLYSAGVLHNIGSLGGGLCQAYGINALGQVVGVSRTNGGTYHAFLYSGGTMQDLGVPVGDNESVANGINASGQVAGYSVSPNSYHAFLYTQGSMQNIGSLPGYSWTVAFGINASGQVVGQSFDPGKPNALAFLYSGGIMHNLGTLGGSDAWAEGINDAGEVVGQSETSTRSVYHAFLYSGGTMHDLGTLGGASSEAKAINASGQVVGRADTSVDGPRGFIYSGGVMHDLNSMLDSTSGGHQISDAAAISDNGYIAVHAGGCASVLTPEESISGIVALQNYGASIGGVLVTVEIRAPGSNTPLDTQTVALDLGGKFSLYTTVPPGTYDVAVKGSHWLRQKLTNLTLTYSGLSGLNYSLINGDVNGDNVVSLADFGVLRAAFGSSSGGSNWNPNADLNGDGTVSLADFGILRANFGKQGDP